MAGHMELGGYMHECATHVTVGTGLFLWWLSKGVSVAQT